MFRCLAATPGDDFDGAYRLGNVLGRGGYSIVWQCYDSKTGQPYAVKHIPANASNLAWMMGVREISVLKELNHRHITHVRAPTLRSSAAWCAEGDL